MKIDNIIIQIIGNWIDQMQKKNWLLEEDREYYQYAMEVSADVFNGDIRSAKIWFCTDIKAVSVFRVHFIFDFAKKNWWFSYEDI